MLAGSAFITLAFRKRSIGWLDTSGPSSFGVPTSPIEDANLSVSAQFDVDTPFMEAGLTSVGVARFTARLRAYSEGEVEVMPTVVFEQPTVRALSAHFLEVAGKNNPKVPSMETVVACISELLLETIAIGGGSGVGEDVQMSPTRVADNLVLAAHDRSGHSIPPLVAAPMMNGTGKPFAQLWRHLKSSLYYCEHPILHDGKNVDRAQYFNHYARSIQAECLLSLWATFDVIGASFGGYNAYRISLAAIGIGFAPRAIVQVDPIPPRAEVRVLVDSDRSWKVECAIGYLIVQLGMVYQMSGQADKGAAVLAALPDQVASWPTEEIALRATDLLAREGVRQFSFADVSQVSRNLIAYEDGQRVLASGLSSRQLPQTSPCETMLVLCTGREEFFAYGMRMMHMNLSSSGFRKARDYGKVSCELLLEGNHLLTCEKCSSGEDATFVQAAQSFLHHADSWRSARWQLRTLARTPVLPFETHEAHDQGQATSVMLHGPPTTHEPLTSRILFVLSNERSGSSLLQLCLQCHSSLYAGQELYLLPFSSLNERCIHLPFEMKEGLLKNLMELRLCSFEDAYFKLCELEVQETTISQMYKSLQDLSYPRILVDKTPHNAAHVNFLVHAHSMFASNAKYCHLIRHPYTCISSGVELRRDVCSNPNITWGEVEDAYVKLQMNVHAFFSEYLNVARARSTTQVFYEDLLREPAWTLTMVCKLIGLEFQSGMDEPYESDSAVASFQAASLMAGTDPKLFKRKKIDPAQADKWRTVKLPHPLHKDTAALAVDYGYDIISSGVPDRSHHGAPHGTAPAASANVPTRDEQGYLAGGRHASRRTPDSPPDSASGEHWSHLFG
jgi:hypothetical protein